MDDERNALAELAETLKRIPNPCIHTKEENVAIRKAQRIIAELAKVKYLTCAGTVVSTVITQADRAIIKCREIAEEGARYGK